MKKWISLRYRNNNSGSFIGWLLLLFPLLTIGALCAFMPWYFIFPLLLFVIILSLLIIRFEWGVYLLLFITIVDPRFIGLSIKSNWNFIVGLNPINLIGVFHPIIMVSFLSFLLRRWSKNKQDIIENPLRFPTWVLFIFASFTLLWSPNIKHSMFQLFILTMNLFLYGLLIDSSITSEIIHKKIMWCLLSSGILQILIVILLYFLSLDAISVKQELSKNVFFHFKVFGDILLPGGYIRRGNALTTPHQTALFMNMIFPVTLGLLLVEKNNFKRKLLIFILILIVSTNLITMTKAALGGLLVMATFLFMALEKLRKHFLILFFTFIIGVFLILVIENSALNTITSKKLSPRVFAELSQIENISREKTPHFTIQRINIWKEGVKQLMQTYFVGIGLGSTKYYTRAPHAHSIYFSFLFDFGLVGLGVILSIMIILGKRFLSMLRFQDTYLQIMCVAFFGGLIAMGIHGLVDFEYNTPVIWLYLGMAVATLNLARQELKSSEISK